MTSRFVIPVADVGPGVSPSDGALLYFYGAGGNIDKATFADAQNLIPNTNPVVANANGIFPDIWITGEYKVILRDNDGVLLYEWDPVVDEAGDIISDINNLDSIITDFDGLAGLPTGLYSFDADTLNRPFGTPTVAAAGFGQVWHYSTAAGATQVAYFNPSTTTGVSQKYTRFLVNGGAWSLWETSIEGLNWVNRIGSFTLSDAENNQMVAMQTGGAPTVFTATVPAVGDVAPNTVIGIRGDGAAAWTLDYTATSIIASGVLEDPSASTQTFPLGSWLTLQATDRGWAIINYSQDLITDTSQVTGFATSTNYRRSLRASVLDPLDYSTATTTQDPTAPFTVGSTSSGADVIWTLLDDLPETTTALNLRIRIAMTPGGGIGQATNIATGAPSEGTPVLRDIIISDRAGAVQDFIALQTEVDSDANGVIFEIDITNASTTSFSFPASLMYLDGYYYT